MSTVFSPFQLFAGLVWTVIITIIDRIAGHKIQRLSHLLQGAAPLVIFRWSARDLARTKCQYEGKAEQVMPV